MGIKSKMESKRYDCSLNQSKSTLSCDFFPLKFPYKHNVYWKIIHIANSWYSKHNKWGSPYSFLAVPDVYNFVFTDLNECYSSPCENGGSCVGDYKNYTCTCTKDWIGRNCEIAHSKLFFSDCLNGLFLLYNLSLCQQNSSREINYLPLSDLGIDCWGRIFTTGLAIIYVHYR